MPPKALHRTLAIYLVASVLFGIFHSLATPGSSDWRWGPLVGDLVGSAIAPLLLGSLLPMIFWAFHRFNREGAAAALTSCGVVAMVVAGLSTAAGFYDRTLSLRAIPENLAGFFTDDHDTFVRVVRNSCEEHQRKQPTPGITRQQVTAFCTCYADALASELTPSELTVALSNDASMIPELRSKVLEAAPACRKRAFGIN